jgi:RNA polymerase sigma factor (sigma-70 family)
LPSDQQLTEQDLAARVQNDVPGAFEEMVRMYQADVRIMTRRHLDNAVAADEVAQDVFVQLFRSISGFRGESSLRTWILGVTRNQIRSFLRNESRRKRRSATVISPELLEAEHAIADLDPFHLKDAEHELSALQVCLKKLGERPRRIVEDFYFNKQSAESIAVDWQQTPGAIRMLLMRVRKRLGECIRSQVNGHGDTSR